MAGRSREPGEERRTERTAIRWTPTEMKGIQDVKEKAGFQYEADVIRVHTLEGIQLRNALKEQFLSGAGSGSLSPDALIALAGRQLRLETATRNAGIESTDELVPLAAQQVKFRKEVSAAGIESTNDIVPLAKRQLALESALRDKTEELKKVQDLLGLNSLEEVIWTLTLRQLDLIGSALEKDVAE